MIPVRPNTQGTRPRRRWARARSYLSPWPRSAPTSPRCTAYKVPITEFTDRVIYRLLNFRSQISLSNSYLTGDAYSRNKSSQSRGTDYHKGPGSSYATRATEGSILSFRRCYSSQPPFVTPVNCHCQLEFYSDFASSVTGDRLAWRQGGPAGGSGVSRVTPENLLRGGLKFQARSSFHGRSRRRKIGLLQFAALTNFQSRSYG